jgi:tetratricopeptide (TPR) repeat protein
VTIDDDWTNPEADPESLAHAALEAGAASLHERDWDKADRHFCEALRWLQEEDGARRAQALVGLAEAYMATARAEQALVCLEQALHAEPHHEAALRRALDLTVWMKRHGLSLELRRRLLTLSLSDEEKAAQRRAMAHDAIFVAIDALEGLRGLELAGFDVLDRLRAAHEAAGDPSKATDVMVAQAEHVTTPHERAGAMVRAADFCAARTGKAARAVALYEAAIADDPAVQGAFEAIERVLVQRADHPELEKAYRRQAERLEEAGAKPELAALLGRLAELRHDRLQDRKGAIEALARRVNIEPANVDARAALATLLEHDGNVDRACRVLETSGWHAPTRVETYHALFRMYTRAKKHDRAFQACAALVHLGDADLDEQMLYQQYRPEAGLRPTSALDEKDWGELYPLEHDANVRAVLEVIGPTAIAYRVAQLEASGKLPVLTAKTRQDPEASTVSAVRSLRWGSQVLRVPLPEIHVLPDLASGISAIAAQQPAIAVGKAVLSGRSVAELAFLVGRDLTYFRPEHRMLIYFPSMPELTALVTTAIRMALPGAAGAASLRDRALAEALEKGLDAAAWERVRTAVQRVESTGSTIDLRGYVRSLEIAATRVGLLLSGDLPTAGKLLSTDVREVAGLRAADRMRDLLPYAVSSPYAALRAKLGVEAM